VVEKFLEWADEQVQTEGDAVEVIDVSAHQPCRIPSKKWRELIKKVWEADPLRCPKRSREIRIVSLIDEEDVIEAILRHLGLWQEGCACIPAATRRAKRPSIRGSTTPSPMAKAWLYGKMQSDAKIVNGDYSWPTFRD